MANGKSDYQTAYIAGGTAPGLHTRPKEKQLQQKVRYFHCQYTGLGNEATGEYIDLGSLNTPKAKLIPELFRIRFLGSGNFSTPIKLVKIVGANAFAYATWTRVTTTATVTATAPHGYVTGQVLTVTVSSDIAAIVLGAVTITVTSPTQFTFTCLNAGATSGSLTIGPAAGSSVDITTSVSFTQAAAYVGVATVGNDLIEINKADTLRLVYGTMVTPFPVTRTLCIEGAYFDET